ncbi:hypothetical protein BH09BAC1_BH09BAC1_04990 [soil metagenome]
MNGVNFRVNLEAEGSDFFDVLIGDIKNAGEGLSGFNKSLMDMGKGFFAINQIREGIQAITEQFDNAVRPGVEFNSQMKELEAVTGASTQALKLIEDGARDTAKVFGVDGAAAVESYKLLLSQLTPEIAKNPAALAKMGENAALLSKQLKGDVAGATEIATTAMNAYRVSLEDPIAAGNEMISMMDQMTKAAGVGSAELPAIKDALANIGSTAVNAGVGFSEMNAAIQVLDKSQLKGAQGGTALRNVIAKLSEGRFLPKDTQKELIAAGVNINKLGDKTIPLAERLSELKKIQHDSALMTKLFGTENVNAGVALLQNIPLMQQYTTEIADSAGATKAFADIIMSSSEEGMNRNAAWLNDLSISFHNALGSYVPFFDAIGKGVGVMGSLGLAIQGFKTIMDIGIIGGMKKAAVATWGFITAQYASMTASLRDAGAKLLTVVPSMIVWTTSLLGATIAQWGLNIAMTANPIGLLIAAFVAVGAAVAAVIYWFDDIKKHLISFAKFMIKLSPFYWLVELIEKIFPGFKDAMSDAFNSVLDWFKALWQTAKDVWNDIKSWFGFGDGDEATITVKKDGGTTTDVKPITAEDIAKLSDAQQRALFERNKHLFAGVTFENAKGVLADVLAGKRGPDGLPLAPGATPADPIAEGLNGVNGATGSQIRNVNFKVDGGVVHQINVYTTTLTEGVGEIKDKLTAAIVDSIRDAETALS